MRAVVRDKDLGFEEIQQQIALLDGSYVLGRLSRRELSPRPK